MWDSFAQHNDNLLSQPLPLESLELVEFLVPNQTETAKSFQGLFSHFQHIERLVITFSLTPFDNLEEEQVYSRKVVEALGHQLHELQYLYLDVLSSLHIDSRMILFDTLIPTLCNWNQKLEILHLSDVLISNEVLLSFV